MPIYEYKCGQCNHRFELRQSFDSEPIALCPRCEGGAVRMILPAPILFKGSGFYITDHRKNSEPASAPKDETASEGAPAAS